ncbi:unannotated protein [freshwater metagenome]|uniref:Unannotated protein n=1 Tax=freshwater metagenome TaxID=449393 RepID=A0A6J7RGQ1_9ZZZZ
MLQSRDQRYMLKISSAAYLLQHISKHGGVNLTISGLGSLPGPGREKHM